VAERISQEQVIMKNPDPWRSLVKERERTQAIAYAEEHRESHVEWHAYFYDWLQSDEQPAAFKSPLGAVENCLDTDTIKEAMLHHDDAIDRYDLILKVLKNGS
jgi:hypothetical protein